MTTYHEPRCVYRCALWVAITALFLLVLSAPWWAT